MIAAWKYFLCCILRLPAYNDSSSSASRGCRCFEIDCRSAKCKSGKIHPKEEFAFGWIFWDAREMDIPQNKKSHASIHCLHGIISAVLCDTLPICAQELFETVHLIVPSHDGDDIIGIELKGRGDICGHLVTVLHGDDVQAISLAEIQRLYRHAFH